MGPNALRAVITGDVPGEGDETCLGRSVGGAGEGGDPPVSPFVEDMRMRQPWVPRRRGRASRA